MSRILYFALRRSNKHYGIKVPDKYYEHGPSTVTENNAVTILWDMLVQTNKDIKANRSDIAVKGKDKRTCLLVAMSFPNEKETSLKIVEKSSKFKDLEVEIEKTWKQNHNNCPSGHWCSQACREGD